MAESIGVACPLLSAHLYLCPSDAPPPVGLPRTHHLRHPHRPDAGLPRGEFQERHQPPSARHQSVSPTLLLPLHSDSPLHQLSRNLGGLFPWLQCLHQFLAPAVRTSIQHSRRVWVDFLSISLKSASYLQNMGGHAIGRMDEREERTLGRRAVEIAQGLTTLERQVPRPHVPSDGNDFVDRQFKSQAEQHNDRFFAMPHRHV